VDGGPTILLPITPDILDSSRIQGVLEQTAALYAILQARDRAEAVAIRSSDRQLDLVITDNCPPRFSCSVVLLLLAAHRPAVPLLKISPSEGQEIVLEPCPSREYCHLFKCEVDLLPLVTSMLLETRRIMCRPEDHLVGVTDAGEHPDACLNNLVVSRRFKTSLCEHGVVRE
jgi:hypothetical protein